MLVIHMSLRAQCCETHRQAQPHRIPALSYYCFLRYIAIESARKVLQIVLSGEALMQDHAS